MLTTFSLDRSQIELATLAGRGATAWQITLMYALESLILALPAAMALGPGLALFASRIWAWVGAETVPTSLPPESWLLAAIGTACGWLAFILPVYPAARRNLLEWQQARARPVRRSVAQRLYLDLFLLGFGALLYWQLNQSQSFVMRRLGDSSLADPLLLLGPSLLIIAVALLFLRLFPFLLRIVAAVFQRTRGVAFPLSLSRLARDPLKPSRVVLLISLTASLTLFAAAFEQSLGTGQTEMAHYLAGADLRVALSGVGRDPPLKIEQVQELSGVLTASRVFRGLVQNREGRGIQLFALDPTTLHRVTRYPTSLTRLTVSSITGVLQSPAGGQPSASADQDVMPAIFSYAALPSRSGVGDELSLNLGGHRLTYGVQGTIRNFPTLDDAFVIASLPDLETRLDLGLFGVRTTGTFEAWLEVDPQQYATLIAHPLLQDRILDDAQARLHIMQGDVLAQGTSGAFQLNALTLAFLSVAGFLLVQFFASKQRLVEFGVLRAMGLSQGQLLSLLAAEGALMTLSGLAAGVVIGYGLAQVMVPFLSQALAESLAGVRITDVLIDWPGIVRLYALLIGFYTLAMLLLLILLKRVGVHRVMRIGDE
jgi:putative ABC transport system permease protein